MMFQSLLQLMPSLPMRGWVAARCQALPGSICSGAETVAELSYLTINAEQASNDKITASYESAACLMLGV